MGTREEYIDKLEAKLREWNEKIDELEKKADKQSQEAKTKIQIRMKDLKAKRSELKLKLDRIKDSGEDAFETIKEDSEKLWKDVKSGLSEISNIIRE